MGRPVPSPPPAWVAWGRRAEVDGRGGGVADATARTILEPAWREGWTPPTRAAASLSLWKSLRAENPVS